MLNSELDGTVVDFPLSQAKPGQYSDKELPKAFTKQTNSPCQKHESTLEQIYHISTSLPVSSALLAAVTSQGVPVGGSLWYLNYSAILVILLTAVALVISYLSTTASHSYCETVFLTIYTPVSQLFNITVNVQDIHQTEDNSDEQTTRQATPTWLKQLLIVCISLSATHGLSLPAIVYAVCITLTYAGLSAQLKRFTGKTTMQKQKLAFTQRDCMYTAAMILSVAADIFIHPVVGVSHLLYFILIDQSSVTAIKSAVENQSLEIMEGLEQYYAEGLVILAEVVFTLVACFAQPCLCLLSIPLVYFCVYRPVQHFRLIVKAIDSESLCMSNFDKATAEEISEYDDVCAVCLCTMSHARITPCKHIFHGKCLKDCLKKKAQCPLCNNQML